MDIISIEVFAVICLDANFLYGCAVCAINCRFELAKLKPRFFVRRMRIVCNVSVVLLAFFVKADKILQSLLLVSG